MKVLKPAFITLLIGSVFAGCNNQPTDPELLRIPYTSTLDQEQHHFFLYLPAGYKDRQNDWPVILFLHGDGERGNGNNELDYVMIHGPLYEAWIQKRNLPFIMIVPQLPMFGRDTLGYDYLSKRDKSKIPKRLKEGVPDRPANFPTNYPMMGSIAADSLPYITLPQGWDLVESDLIGILDNVKAQYHVDKNRIYLTGLSYGGFGTWHMASVHPNLFAAIAPIVGWGHPSLMKPIADANIPVWAFSGGRDRVVPTTYFYPGINELEKLGDTRVRFTVEEDMGHDTWKRVYSGDDIYHWFLHYQLNHP